MGVLEGVQQKVLQNAEDLGLVALYR